MNTDRLIGTVLWISKRDGNGVIISNKTEYYFDTSVCSFFADLERKDIVAFEINDKIKDCNCAKALTR